MDAADRKLKFRKLLQMGRRLLDAHEPVHAHMEFREWVSEVARWFEEDLDNLALSARWGGLPSSSLVSGNEYRNDSEAWALFRRGVQERLNWLGAAFVPVMGGAETKERPTAPAGTKVFVVHGHDGELREACARFLTNQGLEPIILHEQPNRGQTIIEKFESHAQVAFAVALMTKDDEGRKVGDPNVALAPRARQNVVFELGFFLGRLGRHRVCAVYETGIELPSDYNGVVYIEYDRRGAWKIDLLRELAAAGLRTKDSSLS